MKDLTPENAFVSDVEKEVFGKLSSALGESWVGAHNVKLLRGNGKGILGEIDLLLMHPRLGVFVGEIKAGDYSCRRTYASRRQLRRVLPLLKRLVEKHCASASGTVPGFFPFLCFPQTHSRIGKLSTPHMLVPDLENPEAFFQNIVLPENRARSQISVLSALLKNARAEIVFPEEKSLRERLFSCVPAFLKKLFPGRGKSATVPAPSPKSASAKPKKRKKKKENSLPKTTPILSLLADTAHPNRAEALRALLAAGNDPNALAADAVSPLSRAVQRGDRDSAEILFRAGGKIIPFSPRIIRKCFSLFDDALCAEFLEQKILPLPPETSRLFFFVVTTGRIRTFCALLKMFPAETLSKLSCGKKEPFPLLRAVAENKNPEFLYALTTHGFSPEQADVFGVSLRGYVAHRGSPAAKAFFGYDDAEPLAEGASESD